MLKRGVALLLLLCMALPCAATAEQADARRVVPQRRPRIF